VRRKTDLMHPAPLIVSVVGQCVSRGVVVKSRDDRADAAAFRSSLGAYLIESNFLHAYSVFCFWICFIQFLDMKSLEVDRSFSTAGGAVVPGVSGSPRLAMTTIATIAKMATPIAERLNDRVFGKGTPAPPRLRPLSIALPLFSFEPHCFVRPLCLTRPSAVAGDCKLWAWILRSAHGRSIDLMHARRARHDPRNRVGVDFSILWPEFSNSRPGSPVIDNFIQGPQDPCCIAQGPVTCSGAALTFPSEVLRSRDAPRLSIKRDRFGTPRRRSPSTISATDARLAP